MTTQFSTKVGTQISDIELDRLHSTNLEQSHDISHLEMDVQPRPSEESPKTSNSVTVTSPISRRGDSEQVKAHDAKKARRKEFIAGLLLLFIVVILWTSSNFITQDLFEDGFDKPFLVTYLNTSSFALYLIPFIYRYWRTNQNEDRYTYKYDPLPDGGNTAQEAPNTTEEADFGNVEEFSANQQVNPLSTRETATLASIFCFLWFIANWSVNASLRYTSVGSSTVLASTSGLFTMGFGRLMGFEKFSVWRVCAVMTSFLGVVLVSLADSTTPKDPTKTPASVPVQPPTGILPAPSNPLLGDSLALLSAVFYALYVSLLKVRIKTESRINMQLFFGFVGLFNILACWPMGLVLHLTGIERFGWPIGWKEWTGMIINMAVTFSSDFIYVIAMLKTTPLVVTIGLTLTIPLAILGDLVLQSRVVTLEGLCGAIMVIVAFVFIGWEDSMTSAPDPDGTNEGHMA
ncbi:hypothetical protein FRB91_011043 [Serendipita sp. 411]|nr:hypothetical protein FRB91_011043 [Serendipita sp. 411]